ncbi:hypothetical protein B0H14DRAFT_2640505 [Mycena olivaceomarginata]|nr:hypothetical protein B0H14DRAFT_2640505 [Mycena olivaceomarginata]
MDPILKQQLNNLAAEDDDIDEMAEGSNWVDIDAVMEGSERIELSHAGGELQDSLAEGIEEEISVNRRWDWRTRHDRTERRNLDFMAQMPDMILAYMHWCDSEEGGSPISDTDEDTEVYSILVIDMFDTERREIVLDPRGGGISPALIMQGLVPCAPWKPTAAITTRVLEVYQVAHARCPQFAIQAFVKTLCDLHGFSISYDLYLDLCRRTEARLLHRLGHDSFAWRVKHDCPACMYKLKGEDELIFDVLVTLDGGNSLKRALQRNKVESEPGDGPEFVVGESKEYTDNQDASDWYFLAREKVNELAKHRITERMPIEAIEDKTNPCAERWKNMIEDITAKMWGIFDETGIFICLCRHGFVLMIVDMIKSGELAKYPLAVTEALLKHLGERTGTGYDVGCDFETTLKNSPLGQCAKCKNFRCLVGAFHGHAHNRLCQLCFLATYVEGLGLEDLEGCLSRLARRGEGVLLGLQDESKDQTETLEMEYVQKLVNLDTSHAKYVVLATEARKAQGDNTAYTPGTSKAELARRRGKEKVEHDIQTVQELKEHLGIVDRWTTESEKWQSTVALALDPPMASLTWEQVVKYTFLADFDILCDTRDEVQSRPWTRPAYRLAMDSYFKLCRAQEEVQRLNIEIRQVRFQKLAYLNGFTGTIRSGTAVERAGSEVPEDAMDVDVDGVEEEDSDDQGGDEPDEVISSLLYQVSMIGIDGDRDLDNGAA